jgi:hypothetical protein
MKPINYYILFLAVWISSASFGQGLNVKTGATLVNKGNLVHIGNWINDGVFSDTSATVIFSGTTQTIGGTVPSAFNNLTISPGSSTTIISAGQTLSRILLSNGTLDGGGNLTLLSTASRTALIDGNGTGQVVGNVTMQRYLPSGFGYKYFSSPFQGATVSQFGDDINMGASFPPLFRYDENRMSGGNPASGWIKYTYPDSLLRTMRGYAVNFGASALPDTADITGVVNNGSLTLTLYNHNNPYTLGFNLVGNPYPSPINWDAASGWTKTNIDDALYYFKASTTDQYGGTYSTYINKVSSDGLATNIIPSMQGFFVHVANGAFPVTGTLAADNNVRITDLTHSFIKSGEDETKPLLRLTAGFSDDPVSTDPSVIYFDEKAGTTFDSKLDALKLMNTDLKVPNLYAVGSDGNKLSIDALPVALISGCTVPLGIKTYRTGNIVFKVSHLDPLLPVTSIYLSDIVAGINQDLLPGNEYSLSLAAGEHTDRFTLYINSIPTDISGVGTDDYLFRTYYFRGILKTDINIGDLNNGTLVITNLTGRTIFIRKIYDPGHYEFGLEIQPGIYIVTLNSGNRRISRKIFVDD